MKAVIFDLDGTLWDTSDIVVERWNEVLKKKCPKLKMTKEIMSSLMGKNKAEFVDEFFVGVDKTVAKKLIEEIFALEQKYLRENGACLYDGVLATLNALKEKYKLMIVSNCQSGYLDAFLQHYSLKEIISDWECAGSTGLSKGENIQLIMSRNNIKKAIYVGDTKSDETAAKSASVPFVYANYGFGDAYCYDAKIDDFSQIVDVANALLNE